MSIYTSLQITCEKLFYYYDAIFFEDDHDDIECAYCTIGLSDENTMDITCIDYAGKLFFLLLTYCCHSEVVSLPSRFHRNNFITKQI